MRKLVLILTLAAMMLMAMTAMAFANHNAASKNTTGSSDPTASDYNPNKGVDNWGDRDRLPWSTYSGGGVSCSTCHGNEIATIAGGGAVTRQNNKDMHQGRGPHGGYSTTTNNCQTCHRVHLGDNQQLLPGNTVVAVCNYCHDLTGSAQGPYNMLGFSAGNSVKAAHRIVGLHVYSGEDADTATPDNNNSGGAAFTYSPSLANWTDTKNNWVAAAVGAYNVIPGGDNTNGGNVAIQQGNQGGLSEANFTCDSCHTPHAVKGTAVTPYLGDSHVKSGVVDLYNDSKSGGDPTQDKSGKFGATYTMTNRLLKINMNATAVPSKKYGSEWCLACHQGRDNDPMGGKFNHPVDKDAEGYLYIDSAFATDANAILDPDLPVVDGDDNPYRFTAIIDPNASGVASGAGVTDAITRMTRAPYTYSPFAANLVIPADLRSNKMYAMTSALDAGKDPITGVAFEDGSLSFEDFQGLGPSCQQCHGNARDVEKAFAGDGHPHNMTFPHISANKALLTETGDDFCTNCHGLNLP